MASVSGSIEIGEAQAAMASLVKRQRGSNSRYALVLYSFVIVLAVIGFFIGRWAGWNANLTACGAAVVALAVWYFLGRRYIVWQFRKNMTARGVPMHVPVRIELKPDAMIYDSGDVYHRAEWGAVSELYRKSGYWIFMIHSTGYFAPRHFFPDAAAERAFIAEALSHMSEAARARSPDAVKFAASEAA